MPGWPAGGAAGWSGRDPARRLARTAGPAGCGTRRRCSLSCQEGPADAGYRFQAVLVPGPFSVGHNEVVFQVLVRGSAAGAFEEGGDQLLGVLPSGAPAVSQLVVTQMTVRWPSLSGLIVMNQDAVGSRITASMRSVVVTLGVRPVRGTGPGSGIHICTGRSGMPVALPFARIFTIFEGTSEIQRMLIGRAVTGLDVR